LDSFGADLSYSLPIPAGLDLVEVDHGGRVPSMGGMRPLVVVEGDPSADIGLGLRAPVAGERCNRNAAVRPLKSSSINL